MESLMQQISTQQRQEIFNVGKEFAFEGLDESYFKANNEDELKIFREGFQEGLKIQSNSTEPSLQTSLRM